MRDGAKYNRPVGELQKKNLKIYRKIILSSMISDLWSNLILR